MGKPKKQALGVQFNDDLNDTFRFEPYSFELGFKIWYNPDEEAEIRDRNTQILVAMSKMTPDEMEEKLGETTRGLETRLEENAVIANERIKRSIAAVKAMQQLAQRQKGGVKPDAIANAYARSAASAAHDAHMLGELDAKYVSDFVRPKDYVPEKVKPMEDRRKKMQKTSSGGSMRRLLTRIGSSRRVLVRAFSKKHVIAENAPLAVAE